MRQIAADPNVEYVEVDKLYKPVLTPERHRATASSGATSTPPAASAPTRPGTSSTGTGIVVAVLDTGITNHSDLNANIIAGYDFIIDTTVADDGNGRDSDPADPGDWSSRRRSAQLQLARHPRRRHRRGGDQQRQGRRRHRLRRQGRAGARARHVAAATTSDIADGIIWASGGTVSGVPANANPAEVINLSLGGSGACGSHHAERDQRRGRPRHHAGGRGRQQQRQRLQLHAGQLHQRDRGGGSTDQHRRALSFSNYGTGIDVVRAGRRTSCPRSTPAPPRRARRATPTTTAPRWRRRTWPAWSR